MASSAHFSDAELRCPHCGVNGCTQTLVDALEALRAIVGKPIRVTSGYRCAAHNIAVGGAPNSQHVRGNAADCKVKGLSAAELEAAARKVEAFKGIGRNDHSGFVHMDVRQQTAQWCYTKTGARVDYYEAT